MTILRVSIGKRIDLSILIITLSCINNQKNKESLTGAECGVVQNSRPLRKGVVAEYEGLVVQKVWYLRRVRDKGMEVIFGYIISMVVGAHRWRLPQGKPPLDLLVVVVNNEEVCHRHEVPTSFEESGLNPAPEGDHIDTLAGKKVWASYLILRHLLQALLRIPHNVRVVPCPFIRSFFSGPSEVFILQLFTIQFGFQRVSPSPGQRALKYDKIHRGGPGRGSC